MGWGKNGGGFFTQCDTYQVLFGLSLDGLGFFSILCSVCFDFDEKMGVPVTPACNTKRLHLPLNYSLH